MAALENLNVLDARKERITVITASAFSRQSSLIKGPQHHGDKQHSSESVEV